MNDKGKTDTQNTGSRKVELETENRGSLALSPKPELTRQDKPKNPNNKPDYAVYIFWLAIVCASITLMAFPEFRKLLNDNSGLISALATVAIMILTFAYAVYAKSQWRVMEGQLEATRKQIEHQVNTERAWIMVDIDWVPMFVKVETVSTSNGGIIARIRMTCKNDGRTPAWITEKRAGLRIYDSIPKYPEINHTKIIQDGTEPLPVNGHPSVIDSVLECAGEQTLFNKTIVFGVVKYRDAFGDNRETFFGYDITFDGKQIDRIKGFPEYNRNT